MADKDKIRKKSGNSNNSYYAGPGGAAARSAGYNRSAERYRERIRGGGAAGQRSFPNKRRKIITGKDLTTPIRGRARVIEQKRVALHVVTVAVPKERLPWMLISKLLAGVMALLCLICSHIVLFDTDYKINRTAERIKSAHIETNYLERQFELENDPTEILRIAREDYGMVEEMYIQKNYIKSRREDRAVIIEKSRRFLPEIFAFFKIDKEE